MYYKEGDLNMKHKLTCCLTALLMGISLVPASGFFSDVSVVKAADQQKAGNVDGYDYELWNQNYTGTVDMQVGSNGTFSCSWSDTQNCLFNSGKKLGSTKNHQDYGDITINYEVDYQPTGNSYVCAYGWTEYPTVEYYIVEAWGDFRPPEQATSFGTVVSDGNQYDIYKKIIYRPSINGIEAINQYWSVRKRNPAQVNTMNKLKGTVTVSNHFQAWEKAGLKMGKMYNVALSVEGYGSSGKADVKKNEIIMGGNNPDSSTSTNNPSTTTNPSNPVSSDSLKDAFSRCFKIGASVSPNELNSGASFIKKHFNSITPENELKPDSLIDQGACQQRGNNVNTQISLNRASQTLKFCEDNGIALRGHTFVWYSQTPSWFFKENFSDNGAYVSKEIMNQRLESFIKNTFDALKTQYPKLNVYSYDVCNELFLNDGGGLRPADNSNWVRVYGDDTFVIKAFEYARKYAPAGCKLFINDYNEYIPAKTNDIYNMAMKLKEKGLIDGIGMQSHLDVSYPSASVYKTALEKFLSTGLEVQVTELDITCGDATAQAKLFADVFKMCVDHADQIEAVTVWGTHDSISWRRENNPLMFGANYSPKSAYTEVMKVAANAAPPTTTPSTTTPTTPTTPDFKFGDVSKDGKVDITDLTMISLYLLDDIDFDSTQKMSGDVVYDSEVNLADLSLMKQYIMKDDVTLGKGYTAPAATTSATTTQKAPVQTTQSTTKSQQQSGSKTMSGSVVNGVWSSSADVSWIDKSKPMVAFTFDDGPVGTAGSATSMRIQNALKKSGFHATFFYWGNKINGSNSAEIKSAFDAGFEIGNHTYTHNSLSGMSGDGIKNEINQTKTILNGIVGSGDFLVRPPYLSVDQNVSSNAGVPLINCGIDTQDWNGANTSQIVSTLKNAMQNGSLKNKVVLMHETYEATAAAMEELLPYMKQQGWQVVSVSELFKANGKELRAGQVYTGC